LLVLAHDRHRVIHFNVTAHPTAQWTGQQLREAVPFDQFPPYLLRDRNAIFGAAGLMSELWSLLTLGSANLVMDSIHFPQLIPCTECLCRVSLATVDG
jgi:hypothetical protein